MYGTSEISEFRFANSEKCGPKEAKAAPEEADPTFFEQPPWEKPQPLSEQPSWDQLVIS